MAAAKKPKPKAKPKPVVHTIPGSKGTAHKVGPPLTLPAANTDQDRLGASGLDPLNPPPGWGYNSDTQSFVYLGGGKPWFFSGSGWTTAKPDTPPDENKDKDTTAGSGFDWEEYFRGWGLPPDAITTIRGIFTTTADANVAIQRAIAYIRGTDWYKQTYKGIEFGIARGVIGDERDYRSYVNSVNGLFHRYYNRDVNSDEVAGYLLEGVTPTVVGQRFAGAAYIQAYGGEIQYTEGAFDAGRLNPDELKAYGEEQSGLDSPLGQRVAKRIQEASARAQKVAEGVLATPGLTIGGSGLAAPGLTGTKPRPDTSS